jgi:hypothetical protein
MTKAELTVAGLNPRKTVGNLESRDNKVHTGTEDDAGVESKRKAQRDLLHKRKEHSRYPLVLIRGGQESSEKARYITR